MQLEDLKAQYDKLQIKYGAKELTSIYNGGCTNNPDICFVFMNPTGRNIASDPNWKGRKSPWIGTKNIWKLFYRVGLLDEEIYENIMARKPQEWDEEFADLVAHREREKGKVMECIKNAIDNNYSYISNSKRIQGYCGINENDWKNEWIKFGNVFNILINDDILKEIKELVSDGVKEVMLLGQNVNSYGKTLENPVSFAELLRKINEIDGLERIRFMTSHPKDLSDELIDAMRDCDKVCKYLHLPVQSGSSKILEKMNRRYTKEKYLELVDKIKAEIPDIMLSTDIIVGFPGETEEDFQETLDIIKKVKYSTAFTFIYSKRTGTPAATMEDQIPEDIVKDRFDRMLHILNPIIHEVNNSQVGKVIDVLVEEVSKHDEKIMTGRGDNNSLIHFEGSKDLIGQIIKVKIIDNKTFYLIGERI